jgi:hypothetical protein
VEQGAAVVGPSVRPVTYWFGWPGIWLIGDAAGEQAQAGGTQD